MPADIPKEEEPVMKVGSEVITIIDDMPADNTKEEEPVMKVGSEVITIIDDMPADTTDVEQTDTTRKALSEEQLTDKPVVQGTTPAMTITCETPVEERECLSQDLGACCYQKVGNQTMHSEVKNVLWIQCDSCHGWLHTECAGIDPSEVDTSFNCGCQVKLPYCLKRTRVAAATEGLLESVMTDEEIQTLADDLRTGLLRSNRMFLKNHPDFNLKFKQNREAIISIFSEKETTAIIDRVSTVLRHDKKNLKELSFILEVMTPEVTMCILRKLEGFNRYQAEMAFFSHIPFKD
nr:uncharacterized protein LOC129435148 [Misgurnus anguillicaudatus]